MSERGTLLSRSNNDGGGDGGGEANRNRVVTPHIGMVSSFFLILNKMIGTGIFSTPSSIYLAVGRVGPAILVWVIGGIITASGFSVYLEFGLEIPKSGGEKNYIERLVPRPRGLVASVFMSQIVLLGISSGNAFAFGRYVLLAAGIENPSDYWARLISVLCVTACCLLHGLWTRAGIKFMNILGSVKLIVLAGIVVCGLLVSLRLIPTAEPTDNLHNIWSYDGFGGGPYNYGVSLLRVIYSYKGWENVNYVLDEVRHPRRRVLGLSGAAAVLLCSVLYVSATLAYFITVDKQAMASSGVIVAGLFFKTVTGGSQTATNVLVPLLIALSNLGNVLAVSFSHARINQELGRDGLLPFSSIFAGKHHDSDIKESHNQQAVLPVASSSTNIYGSVNEAEESLKEENEQEEQTKGFVHDPTPAPAALALHWVVTVAVLVLPPPGPVYELIIDLYTYPGAVINLVIAFGLILLHRQERKALKLGLNPKWGQVASSGDGWFSPWILTFTFFIANIFLVVMPWIPPIKVDQPVSSYPYFLAPLISCIVLGIGVIYWYIYRDWMALHG